MEIKKSVFTVVVLGVIVIASVIIFLVLPSKTTVVENNSVTKKVRTAQVTKVDEDKLPNKFPSNLPVEDGAKIDQNFNAIEADGRFNATREFESKKTLAQNITIYRDYMKANGWVIKTALNQPTLKMVMSQKNKQQLQVAASQNPTTKATIVTITLTEFK